MHIKNITKNYSLLNVLIGEFYVVENVDFSRLKGSFKLQTKKCHILKVNFVTLIKYAFELKVVIIVLRAI